MNDDGEGNQVLATARQLLNAEATTLGEVAAALDIQFQELAEQVSANRGTVFVAGVGKSALVARKVAGTLASVGVKAIALAPTDALHGELGLVGKGDVVLALSKSGASAELVALAAASQGRGARVGAIVCRADSPLCRYADWVVVLNVLSEATDLPLPTSSALAMVALGDALAAVAIRLRNYTVEDFAANHPAGNLGALVGLTVGEVMHQAPDDIALARDSDPVWEVLLRMSSHPFGAALVVDAAGMLLGIVTDGDIRRGISKGEPFHFLHQPIGQEMTRDPVTCGPETTALAALRLMEEGTRKPVYVLPVIDGERRVIGLVRMHNLARLQLSMRDDLA